MLCDTECWERAKPLDRQAGYKPDSVAGISVQAGPADEARLVREVRENAECMRVILEAMLTGENPPELDQISQYVGRQTVQRVTN